MLQNEYLVANIGVDTAENEPFKVCGSKQAPPTPGHERRSGFFFEMAFFVAFFADVEPSFGLVFAFFVVTVLRPLVFFAVIIISQVIAKARASTIREPSIKIVRIDLAPRTSLKTQ